MRKCYGWNVGYGILMNYCADIFISCLFFTTTKTQKYSVNYPIRQRKTVNPPKQAPATCECLAFLLKMIKLHSNLLIFDK